MIDTTALRAKLQATAAAKQPQQAPVVVAQPVKTNPLSALAALNATLKKPTPEAIVSDMPTAAPATPSNATPTVNNTSPAPAAQIIHSPTVSALEKLRALMGNKPTTIPAEAVRKAVLEAPTASPIAQQIAAAKEQSISTQEAAAVPDAFSGTGTAAIVNLNEKQLAAVQLGREGKSFCLIGSAGTGKTTTERELVRVIAESLCTDMRADPEKFQPSAYIVVCAFTRRAVRNTYKALSVLGDKYTACCKTVHKALEYKPVVEDYLNKDDEWAQRKIYRPHVTKESPNYDIRIIVVDEASMLGYGVLYRQLREGFPNAIFVFVGDLNQLRPVMDDPTLAYALASLPVVELDHVYRQALDSPIVEFQYKHTLAGKAPSAMDLKAYNDMKKGLTFFALGWPKLADTSKYNTMFVNTILKPSFKQGTYTPEDCAILIPYNKAGTFGATDLNLDIAQFLGEERGATVHEVIAGYQRRYYAVGDYVMFERRECEIIDIGFNSGYNGMPVMQASPHLSRHGYYVDDAVDMDDDLFAGEVNKDKLEFLLAQSMEDTKEEDDEEGSATRKASHVITVRDRETGDIDELTTNKDILELEFSYAMTVHKSQGSEWRKVYFIMHDCHKNVTRELLYTGMTRAREELVLLYSKGAGLGSDLSRSSIAKAINRQEIVGRTWQEKAQVYKMKLNNGNADIAVDMDWFVE